MKRSLLITPEPIDEGKLVLERQMSHAMGAAVYFAGVVRGEEGNAVIQGITYEAFQRMADISLA